MNTIHSVAQLLTSYLITEGIVTAPVGLGVTYETLYPTADAYIPSTGGNYGNNTSLLVGHQSFAGTSIHTRSLLRFDLSSVLSITEATLRLHLNSVIQNTPPQDYYLAGLSQPAWVEDEVNWTRYSVGNNWATGGGDFGAVADTVTLSGGETQANWDATALVVGSIGGNIDLIIYGEETPNYNNAFAAGSQDAVDQNTWPQLILTNPVSDWPGYIAQLPTNPNNAVVAMDQAGITEGRLQSTGETIGHPGLQFLVRAETFEEGYQKANEICIAMDLVRNTIVVIGSNSYTLLAVSKRGTTVYLGTDENNRSMFSINIIVSVRQE
jgi:hypothetical protein